MPLQSQQICQISRQQAHCRGFETQSGFFLNVILQELCQNYDFDLARGSYNTTMTGATAPIGNLNAQLASGPFPLPTDYLRAKEGDIYYYPIGLGNQPFSLTPIDIEEFDGLFQTAGFQNYPAFFVTDVSQSPPVFYVWPPANGAYPILIRYYRQMPDIVSPELSAAVPWFPNQQFLIDELAGRLKKHTGDSDALTELAASRAVLDRYLKMKDDKENRAQRVKLDRRRFGVAWQALPRSKFFGGW